MIVAVGVFIVKVTVVPSGTGVPAALTMMASTSFRLLPSAVVVVVIPTIWLAVAEGGRSVKWTVVNRFAGALISLRKSGVPLMSTAAVTVTGPTVALLEKEFATPRWRMPVGGLGAVPLEILKGTT